ncbi:MAG: RNA 2'-phosphotransferase, partial [Thermoproteota archaeon]
GFVSLNQLLEKLRQRFPVDKSYILNLVGNSDKRRFEILGDKIRAVYGHTIPVELNWEVDKTISALYHGTTPKAASKILRIGLKSMNRRWVHLSTTKELAVNVGLRRTNNPVILEVDTEAARKNGIKFYKATDKVYLSSYIKPEYIQRVI